MAFDIESCYKGAVDIIADSDSCIKSDGTENSYYCHLTRESDNSQVALLQYNMSQDFLNISNVTDAPKSCVLLVCQSFHGELGNFSCNLYKYQCNSQLCSGISGECRQGTTIIQLHVTV